MPKRSSKNKTDEPNQEPAADPVVEPAVEPVLPPPASASPSGGKNEAAVSLGRLGGKKGGPARAAKLTKEQRSEIAKKAAQARWSKSEE